MGFVEPMLAGGVSTISGESCVKVVPLSKLPEVSTVS
jgi:hypothetical protein